MEAIQSTVLAILIDIIHIAHKSVIEPLSHLLSILRRKPDVGKYYRNKLVWITGASSGIGEAIAKRLAENGAHLILSGRNMDNLEATAASCRTISQDSKVLVFPLDMEKFDTFPDVLDKLNPLLQSAGMSTTINVLVNNAGISSRGSAVETNMVTLSKLMAVNFFGPVALTKAVLPDMINRGEGAIAVISSVQGKIALPFRTSYSASKHAVQAYFDSLRAEVAKQGVTVTIISPGYVATALSLNAVNADGSAYGKMDDTQANGLPPSAVAQRVLESVANGEADVVIAEPKAMAAIQLKTLFPELMAMIMKKRAK